MNALEAIVDIMDDGDKEAFIAYLDKKNKRNDVKNIKLFKQLKTDDINTKNKIAKNNDAYHALRKRLYDSLIDFMGNRVFEKGTSDENEVVRLLVVSRTFFEHKLVKTAYKCLAKAEVKGARLENYNLLNDIYTAQIQFAHLDPGFDLDAVLDKFMANRVKRNAEEQLNLAYAYVRKELSDIYHKGKIVNLYDLITDALQKFDISLDEVLTFKSLYQILFVANEYASIQNDYSLIEPFLNRAYDFITKNEQLAERHLYYHIYILYFMSNIHFRNRRYALSKEYLELMHRQMLMQKREYYSRFYNRYCLLLALNENYEGNPVKAIEIIQKVLADSKRDPSESNDIRLSMVVFYMQQQRSREAAMHMRDFNHTDAWYEKKMGMDWTIKKCLIELLLHIDLENTEIALTRVKGFKKRYKSYLEQVNESRVLQFATLIEQYIKKPEIIGTDSFKSKVESLIDNNSKQDVFVLSYIGWLTAKVNKTPTYDTTLALLKQE